MFKEKTFELLDQVNGWLKDHDPIQFPTAHAEDSSASGAPSTGQVAGGISGVIAGAVVGGLTGDAWGSIAGAIAGGASGTIIGASAPGGELSSGNND